MDHLTDNMNPGEKKKKGLYPRVISRKTVFLDELLQKATEESSLSTAEARMAFDTIFEQLIKELKRGNSVCLDNIGLFSLTAGSRRVQDKNEIRSASIAVKRLAFRMSRAFLKKLGYVEFVRLPANRKK
jgi:predicted histone-like DNA-binding protein